MLKKFSSIVNWLDDANLVARTQLYFGISFIGLKKASENDDETKYSDDKPNSTKSNIKSVQLLDGQKCLFSVERKLIYWFFLFITHMGNEVFYITFLPTLVWLFVERIMHLTCLSWAICMFLGQATKDIIK